MITVQTGIGPKEVKPLSILGPLAVHRALDGNGEPTKGRNPEFVITHVPSGLQCSSPLGVLDRAKLALYYMKMMADWPEWKDPQSHLATLAQRMREIRKTGDLGK